MQVPGFIPDQSNKTLSWWGPGICILNKIQRFFLYTLKFENQYSSLLCIWLYYCFLLESPFSSPLHNPVLIFKAQHKYSFFWAVSSVSWLPHTTDRVQGNVCYGMGQLGQLEWSCRTGSEFCTQKLYASVCAYKWRTTRVVKGVNS